jgi:hypothetical protein
LSPARKLVDKATSLGERCFWLLYFLRLVSKRLRRWMQDLRHRRW